MITLYGTPKSRALRVSWLLEELGIDWDFHFINFARGDSRSAEFLSLNPGGKVPVLVDDDLVLTESAAICVYLAEKYGQGKLLPLAGTAQSAKHHEWISFIITEFEQALWSMGKHRFALPEAQRLPEMQTVARWEFDKAAALAEARMPESEFLLGDSISVADILLAHILLWATLFEQTIPPKLAAFRDKLQRRASFASAIAKTEAIAAQSK